MVDAVFAERSRNISRLCEILRQRIGAENSKDLAAIVEKNKRTLKKIDLEYLSRISLGRDQVWENDRSRSLIEFVLRQPKRYVGFLMFSSVALMPRYLLHVLVYPPPSPLQFLKAYCR